MNHDLLDGVEESGVDEVSKTFCRSGGLHQSLQGSQKRFQQSSLIE